VVHADETGWRTNGKSGYLWTLTNDRHTLYHIDRSRSGKVIVDLPFFFESLELAARTGPRTPEVLRNVQQGGVAPRIEEPEALLLARVDAEGRITESSEQCRWAHVARHSTTRRPRAAPCASPSAHLPRGAVDAG
jgi:hypothetical protein